MLNRMLWALILTIGLFSMAIGQGVDPNDPNEPDTLYIANVEIDAGQAAIVEVSFFNDEELAGLTIPLHWSSADITLDSVSFVGSRIDYINTKPLTIYNEVQDVVFGTIVFFETDIQPGNGLMATLYFDVPPGTSDQFVEIDTLSHGPAGLLFTLVSSANFVPQVIAGQIKIGNPPEFAHFELSSASMEFEGIVGFPGPPNKILSITNSGGGALVWTASISSGWLSINPSSGTAPSVRSIDVDISGLPEGIYEDTIWLSAPNTDNSPMPLPVTLTITSLPPEIQFSPSEFNISGIQGGVNPDDKYLFISNDIPGSELNWSVANSSGWLSLDPFSGIPPDSVRLSFDITGLSFGNYTDTIVISDPAAANNPQQVPVNLQIVSDLPVLQIDPEVLHVIVQAGESAPPEGVNIYNSGEGVMTFTVTENSSRIVGVTPSSGTAPETVVLSFKTFPLSVGDYYDTVTVTSPEAINSPQQFIVHFHVSSNPATMAVLPSNITMSYFECWQGPMALPPIRTFQIVNTGADSMAWWLDYESDWFILNSNSGVDDQILTLTLDAEGMPLGTYVDTIIVYSDDALNSPKKIVVTLNVVPGTETPELVSSKNNIDIPAQEVFGTALNLFAITELFNNHPGCMDWWVEEDIPWLNFVDSSGEAPSQPRVGVEMGSYTYGVYPDSFYVYSASASNSPLKIYVNMIVWRLHGDVNWTNNIDVSDPVYMINTVFHHGPGSQPEYLVGDCNCDHFGNVADIVYLINYVFNHGDAPCGNL